MATADITATRIMGILNVTPDSFYDGGRYVDTRTAIDHVLAMVRDGADIIDIGGESSRSGARPVSAAEEIDRICPVIEEVKKRVTVPISVDTYKSSVAEAALTAGATIVNDISGLHADSGMASVAARHDAFIVLMHMRGTPETMQNDTRYVDVVGEVADSLSQSARSAIRQGISREKIIVDPGIGFGKTLDDNYKIINSISVFSSMGYPVLVGLSRKSLIGGLIGAADDRLPGTIALNAVAAYHGADIIRVHDVREHRLAMRMIDHLRTIRGTRNEGI